MPKAGMLTWGVYMILADTMQQFARISRVEPSACRNPIYKYSFFSKLSAQELAAMCIFWKGPKNGSIEVEFLTESETNPGTIWVSQG